jgi:hypothetical protein
MLKKNVRLQSLFTLSEIISPYSDKEQIKQEILLKRIEWLSVVEIANTHFLTASLYFSLLDKGLLNFIEDEELLNYLEQIYTINKHRNLKIIDQSKEIAEILLKKEIKPVFLKGAASLLLNDYKDVGMRFLSDIDFYVSENHFPEAKEQLLSSGYIPNISEGMDIEKHHHWWPMYHPHWDVVIELHRSILTFPYSQLIECDARNCQNAANHTNIALLSPTFRLIHTFIHSEIVDRKHALKEIDLRQLYEMSMLIDTYQSQIEWAYIEKYFQRHKMWDQFNDTLCLIDELFKIDSPISVHNAKSRLHIKTLYYFFTHRNTCLTNTCTHFQNFLFAISYRHIRMKYGASTTKEYIYDILKQLKKGIDNLKSP